MPGIDPTADAGAVPFDPFELKDMVSGSIRDPYPRLHELCRESPVHTGPIDLGEGAEIARPGQAAARDGLRVRRGRPGAARRRDVLERRLRRRRRDGDGPDHPADGRARAPEDPLPRRVELPVPDARALGGRARGRRGQRAHRLVHSAGPVGSGAGGDVQLPGAGDRAHPRAPPRRLPAVPALGPRADERRGELGPRRGRVGCAAGLLRRGDGGAPRRAGRRPDQRSGAGRGRRGAPQRRGDLLVPAPPAARRRRDDLPRHGQPPVRPARRPAPARMRSTATARCTPRPSRRCSAGNHP